MAGKPKKVINGTTVCSVCKEWKPLDAFPPDNRTTFGRHSRCYECKRAGEREYQKSEKYLARRRMMEWKKRGIIDITADRYKEILAAQGGMCAICGATQGPRGKSLCVDHDHATGETRGILCTKCNVAIGYLRDDPMLVARALAYLTNSSMEVAV